MSCTTKFLIAGRCTAAALILWLLAAGCYSSPTVAEQRKEAVRGDAKSEPAAAVGDEEAEPAAPSEDENPDETPAGSPADNPADHPDSGSADAPAERKAVAKPEQIAATHVVALREAVGKRVTVFGRIQRTAKSGSGHQFLNFADTELSGVCLPESVKRFKDGAPIDVYKNKHVELTGKLELYKGKLQIQFSEPAQIKIVEASSEPAKSVELKQVGKDAWVSPAGLRYQGRDPEGLTRVEHVKRHVADQPKRDGSHGVFDGGEGVAFAVIDEAWQLIEKKKIRAEVEGNRSAYVVALGRRIGYLGGRTGAERRNPPLTRVFLVVETGTKNVVTAFPK